MYKENRSNYLSQVQHPSNESSYHAPKPCIKIGYKVVRQPLEPTKQPRKRAVSFHQLHKQSKHGKKLQQSRNQNNSGYFSNSSYMTKQQNQAEAPQGRKSIKETYDKYRSGKQVTEELKPELKHNEDASRRSEMKRSTSSTLRALPNYNREDDIKNVMEYQYARQYRDNKITQKCNQVDTKERKVNFKDINAYDFRKRPVFR